MTEIFKSMTPGPAKSDLKDLQQTLGDDDAFRNAFLKAMGAAQPAKSSKWTVPATISAVEWDKARPSPDCIVKNLLFADVATFIAPGGTGKTTLILKQAVHIALGMPLFGLDVLKPGKVLLLTSEDSREIMVARLRSICNAMNLTAEARQAVRERVLISDVSGQGFKLTQVSNDVVLPTNEVDQIVTACRADPPVLVVIDPAVSFGVGESRVNDAEQGLVEAARRLRNGLNCCVQYIHHTGKENAREKSVDQYSGRGGSAFSDGSRMVFVLQSMTPNDWRKETGEELQAGETGLRLARPKMSYTPPQSDILIRRRGYSFEHVERAKVNPQAEAQAIANQVWQFLTHELAAGRRYSKTSLAVMGITGLTREEIRSAMAVLEATGRIDNRDWPEKRKGGAKFYSHPVEPGSNTALAEPFAPPDQPGVPKDESNLCHANEISAFGTPPPIGKTETAYQNTPSHLPVSIGTPNTNGAPTAHQAYQSEAVQP